TDGTARRQVTDDAARERHPRFSPDGRRLAFHGDRTGKWEIWTIGTDGGGATQVTRDASSPRIEPVWSSDGTRIAFNETMAGQIATLDATGRAIRIETIPGPEEGLGAMPMAWSDDGRRLLVGIVRTQG